MERFPIYLRLSEHVAGWTRGPEAAELMQATYNLPSDAVVIEIGSFLGSGSILLAGARKLRRSGQVHCVDPFDGSGDAPSLPEYARILSSHANTSQLDAFRENVRNAGLVRWVSIHQGPAEEIGQNWSPPVDLLFMDGDQSPKGVSAAFASWERSLKPNAVLALHNSTPREYAPEHDGHFQLRERLLAGSDYVLTQEVGSTSFFRKQGT